MRGGKRPGAGRKKGVPNKASAARELEAQASGETPADIMLAAMREFWRHDAGVPLYPELMAELDAIKRDRIGGLMLRRDWGSKGPWPTWPKPDEPDFTHMSRKVKQIIRGANLRDELSFTSFRHGGFTEAGDAELTDREIMAQGRHSSPKVLPKYVKRTTKQIATGTKKRRAVRTKDGHLSE